MVPRRFCAAFLVVTCVLCVASSVRAQGCEEDTGHWYTIIDEDTGRVVLQTCHVVVVGDEFVDPQNRRYRVVSVEGYTARARLVEQIDLKAAAAAFRAAWMRELSVTGLATPRRLAQAPAGRLVAIYHTHSDESYIPTSGTPSVAPHGDVYNVGAVIRERLRRTVGLRAVQSWASHLPHDGSAYERSRRTAVALLRRNPDALFDLHRDAAPLEAYATTVAGKPGAKVMIVLGRQNPNLKANEQFAFAVKSFADKNFPGFVRGIFYGDATFNQDLSPRALLFEMGSYENSQQAAERVMVDFILSIPAVLYGVTPQGRTAGTEAARRAAGEQSRAVSALAWVVIVVLIGGAGFLLLNERSLDGVRRRLRRLASVEFASILGLRKRSEPRQNEGGRGDGNRNRDGDADGTGAGEAGGTGGACAEPQGQGSTDPSV
ncbi:MAG: stage II sporulation protein P [Clostridia bacterium]